MTRSLVVPTPLAEVIDQAQSAYAIECVFNDRKRTKTGMAEFLLDYAAFLKRKDKISDEDFSAIQLVSTGYARTTEGAMQ